MLGKHRGISSVEYLGRQPVVRPNRPPSEVGTALTRRPVPGCVLVQHEVLLNKPGQARHKQVPMGRF